MWGTLLLLSSSCGDNGLTVFNTDPEVVITAPADGAVFPEGLPVSFEATVRDGESPLADLDLSWTTGAGPLIGQQTLDGDAVTLLVDDLPTGAFEVVLTAIDPDGASGEDRVSVTVIPNAPPTAAFTSPEDGSRFLLDTPIPVRLEVADDRDAPEDLVLTWGGVAADQGPDRPNGDGVASLSLVGLPVGPATLEVTVTDTLGAVAHAAIGLVIADGDADGDGFIAVADGGTDCDDGDERVHPGAEERCNGIDDDCNGAVDEENPTAPLWYRDGDDDGYGDPDRTRRACDRPTGWVADGTDCDDDDDGLHPGIDGDDDGVDACRDCDDADPDVYPGAPEVCDGKDDDCDGAIPEEEILDEDGDGAIACADCDDGDDTVFPGAPESCNATDDDCDGRIDDGPGACDCPVFSDDDGRTYLFCEGGLNWGEAAAYCDAFGYGLLSIGAPSQNTFVRDTIAAFPWQEPTTGQDADDAWWTGGYRPIRTGADCNPGGDPADWPWSWTDGTPWTSPNWRFGEPNNLTGCEGCVEVWFDGGWNDEDCGARRNWICEAD